MPNSFQHLGKNGSKMPKQVRHDACVLEVINFKKTSGYIFRSIEFPDDLSLAADF